MIPYDEPRGTMSDRDIKMMEEVKAFIDAGIPAAELWKDDRVVDQRNVVLYKRVIRKMRLSNQLEMHQRRGKIIIRKKENR